MVKLILKSKTQIHQELEDVYDFESQTTFKGKEYVSYDSALDTAPRELELVEIIKNEELFCVEIYVKHNDQEYPLHESWISGVQIDGTNYTFDHNKSWTQSENIKTNQQYKFFNLSTLSIIENTSCCVSCGASIDTPNEFDLCDTCQDELVKVNNHSYKPSPNFIGECENKKFYGIELEYGFNSKKEALKVMAKHSKHVYLKSDSSISGGQFRAEVVSHPHTFSELMSDKSFIHTVAAASVEKHENNGCHVHIGRTAFKDKKHYAMFYFLLYSSQELLEHIGGRKLNNYCPFKPIGKVFSKDNSPISMDRYNVINENNEATVEVRFFDSTNNPTHLKVYIQFLDSLIEYTRTANKRITLKDYFKYVAKHINTYSELHKTITNFKAEVQNVIIYREPVEKLYTLAKLTIADLSNITEIVMKNGDLYHVQGDTSHFSFYNNNTTLEFRGRKKGKGGGSGSCSVALNDIVTVKVTK